MKVFAGLLNALGLELILVLVVTVIWMVCR